MPRSSLNLAPAPARSLRVAIHAAVFALPLLAAVAPHTFAADASHQSAHRYSIPAGPLSAVLSRFASDSGILLSTPARVTQGKQSPGLQGDYDVGGGLQKILQGSGLNAVQDAQGTWSLVPAGSDQSASTELGPLYIESSLGNALGSVEGYNASHSSVATKTSKALAKTTQSVSVVTRQQMDEQGSRTVAEAVRYTPGVVSNLYGSTHRYDYLALRGINDGSVDNVIIDGLKSMGDPGSYTTLSIDPYFLERIDILKGPSSVLYGRSNPGGLASLTTKRPEYERSGQLDVSYGSHDMKTTGFDFTGPLSDTMAYRVVGLAKDGNTQIDGVEETRYTLMPSLTMDLDDDTTLNLHAYLQHDPNGGWHGSLPASGTLHQRNGYRLPASFFEGDKHIEHFNRTQQMVGYELEHRFNEVWSARQNFRYLDAKVDNHQVWQSGYTSATSNDLYRGYSGGQEHLHSWILDNMLQAKFDTGPFAHTVVAGLDYQYMKNRVDYTYDYSSVTPLDVTAPVYDGNDLSSLATSSDALRRQKQAGLYLQDLVEVGHWNFSAGLRQDWYDVSIDDYYAQSKDANVGNKLSGHLGALYTFDNGIAPYGSYSTSFNPTSNYSSSAQILKPTTGEQWELGVKYQPPGTDDLYTVAVYDMTMDNLFAKENDLSTSSFYKGVGQIKSKGLELEARTNVTPNLRVIGSYTWNDVEYSKSYFVYNSAGSLVDANGNTPYQTPGHLASGWADYHFDDSTLLGGFNVGAGVRYVGSSWGNDAHDFKVPSYTLYDASVSYDLSRVGLKGTSVKVNANNLTNEYYVASCYSANACYVGEKRNVTATVSYKF
jgi:iron complex outermembrane receptor protein